MAYPFPTLWTPKVDLNQTPPGQSTNYWGAADAAIVSQSFLSASSSVNAISSSLSSALGRYTNVLDFGAVGNGQGGAVASGNVTAFNAAFAKGHPVYVPAGTYVINGPLKMQYSYGLIGDGERTTIIGWDTGSDGTNIDMVYCGTKNTLIERISINGASIAKPPRSSVCFSGGMDGSQLQYNTIRHVWTSGAGIGMYCTTGSTGLNGPHDTFTWDTCNIWGNQYGFIFEGKNWDLNTVKNTYIGTNGNSGSIGVWYKQGSPTLSNMSSNNYDRVWFVAGAGTGSIAMQIDCETHNFVLNQVGWEANFSAALLVNWNTSMIMRDTGFTYYIPLQLGGNAGLTIWGERVQFGCNLSASGNPYGIIFPPVGTLSGTLTLNISGEPTTPGTFAVNNVSCTPQQYWASGVMNPTMGGIKIKYDPTSVETFPEFERHWRIMELAPGPLGNTNTTRYGPSLRIYASTPDNTGTSANWTDGRTALIHGFQAFDPTHRIFSVDAQGGSIYQEKLTSGAHPYGRADSKLYMLGRTDYGPYTDNKSNYAGVSNWLQGDLLLNTAFSTASYTGSAVLLGWTCLTGGQVPASVWSQVYAQTQPTAFGNVIANTNTGSVAISGATALSSSNFVNSANLNVAMSSSVTTIGINYPGYYEITLDASVHVTATGGFTSSWWIGKNGTQQGGAGTTYGLYAVKYLSGGQPTDVRLGGIIQAAAGDQISITGSASLPVTITFDAFSYRVKRIS